MSAGGTPAPMTRAEKLAALAKRGFAVDADGRVFCKGCGEDAIWLQSAKAGEWAPVGCPRRPPCPRPRSPKPNAGALQ